MQERQGADVVATRPRLTLQGLSLFVLGGMVAVGTLALVLYATFDPQATKSFGLSQDMAEVVAAAYGPILVGSLVGYRNFAVSAVQVGRRPSEDRTVPITAGASILYAIVLLGILSGAGTLLLISRGMKDGSARWLLAGSAAFWSGTIGFVYSKFMSTLDDTASPAK